MRWSRETLSHLSRLAQSRHAADAGVFTIRATTLLTEEAARRAREAALSDGGSSTTADDPRHLLLPYWRDAVGGPDAFSFLPDSDLRLLSSGLVAAAERGLPPLPPQLCRFLQGGGGGGSEEEEERAAGTRPLGPDPHGAPFVAGFTWPSAICEGARYLPWLAERLRRAGGELRRHRVRSVEALLSGDEEARGEEEEQWLQQQQQQEDEEMEREARWALLGEEDDIGVAPPPPPPPSTTTPPKPQRGFDAVIDAAGLRAPELFPDDDQQVYPIRGHVLRVKAPWVRDALFGETAHNGGTGIYILPNADSVVIGGTGGVRDGSRVPRAEERAAILRAALALCPALWRAEPVGEWVGLRPGRTRARVGEVEWVGGRPVVHDYGHGGSGLTMAWGCAGDVLRAVERALER